MTGMDFGSVSIHQPIPTGTGNNTYTYSDKIGRDYRRYLLADDINNWQTIPKKLVALAGHTYEGEQTYAICIPAALLNDNNSIQGWKYTKFKRQLVINNQSLQWGQAIGRKKPIMLDPPVGKKAFLASITVALYDFNEMMPNYRPAYLIEHYPDLFTTQSDTVKSNAFGNGIDGLVVGVKNHAWSNALAGDEGYDRSERYTTANYPLFPSENYARRQYELKAMDILNQTAPRSSVRGGMLPTDWMLNQFGISVGASLKTTPFDNTSNAMPPYSYFVYDSGGRTALTDHIDNLSYASNGDGFLNLGEDMILPSMTAEVNKFIDTETVNKLVVEVWGGGWFVPVPWNDDIAYAKGLGALPTGVYVTMVQMPCKVQLDIRYETPDQTS